MSNLSQGKHLKNANLKPEKHWGNKVLVYKYEFLDFLRYMYLLHHK